MKESRVYTDGCVLDGAAGMVLTRQRIADSDVEIHFSETLPELEFLRPPPGWEDAQQVSIEFPLGYSTYTSVSIPQAIHQALEVATCDKVILNCRIHGTGRFALGMKR